MKLSKLIGSLLVAGAMGAVAIVTTPTTSAQAATKVQSAKKTLLKSYPKNMRRTWYRYEKGHYARTKITAKKNTGDVLHYFNPNKKWPTITKTNQDWAFAFKMGNGVVGSSPWWMLDSWKTVNDMGAVLNQKVTTKTYKGKKVKVLKELNANSRPVNWRYSYSSKKMAKHFNPKGTVLWAENN
ncbi:hypothetical protein FC99_GL000743 [Levilactobacillus koreensis JCM 16448]|uniref:Uncharacterized protein n=1 Tax=Levilactobacillus koreensis TaxID=637971 RepID=A0AAC8UUC9_9LACO|nr:hypothetical protein [Levilactobacillus koreensis]AKP64121.1 hypothetical protein ABN16_03300 [Levilactobacillus koreensis]KRK87938.1 hypothetical protein FC99_GL000743 [Levilactobacillus koreensis JCM 16448]